VLAVCDIFDKWQKNPVKPVPLLLLSRCYYRC